MYLFNRLAFLRLENSVVVEVAEVFMAAEMPLLLDVFEENEDFEIHDVGHLEDGLHEHLEDRRLKRHHLRVEIQGAQWRERIQHRPTRTHDDEGVEIMGGNA